MKKIISLLLTSIMLLALLPFSAFSASADSFVNDGVKYVLSNDGTYYYVDGCIPAATNITIVSEHNGIPVTTIDGYAFYRHEKLTSIEIPNSVTSIANDAFNNCGNLINIEIPNSVNLIGDGAFEYCNKITNITIPENAVLGSSIFEGCNNISFTTYENIKYFGTKNNPYQIAYDVIDNTLSSYTIHPQTKQIGGAAFSSCTSLTSIIIPNTVTTIGNASFYNCEILTNIEIPNSITLIGSRAFEDCKSITSIEIPNSVTSVGSCAFSGCDFLTDIYCEAREQPTGWVSYWCYESIWGSTIDATIHWGVDMGNTPIVEIKLGDVNGNGEIDSMDYILLKRNYFGTYDFTDEEFARGDVNSNDEIDSMDYILLKRAYFGTYIIL